MPEGKQFVVQDLGPIKALRIPIPEEGGVVVLKGTRGVGKSTALRSLTAATRGETAGISKRDNAPYGKIEGLGVSVTLNRTARRDGQLVVEALDGTSVSAIVDPGIKDPILADKARVKAIVAVSKLKVDASKFEGLGLETPDIVRAISGNESNPIEAGAAVKKLIDKQAREEESRVDKLTGEYESLQKGLLGSTAMTEAEMRPDAVIDELIDKLKGDLRDLQSDAKWVEQHRPDYESAKGPKTDEAKESEPKHRELGEIHEDRDKIAKRMADLRREIDSLLQNDVQLEREYAAADAAKKAKASAAAALEKAQAASAAIVKAFEEKMGRDFPAEITATELAITELRDEKLKNATARVRIADAERMDSVAASIEESKKKAKLLRESAHKAEEVVRGLMPAGLPLSMKDDRLVVKTDRSETELFSDLSEGERWTIGIDIAVASVGDGGLIVIPQIAWDGIPPKTRKEIADHARAKKVVCITAESTDDEGIVTEVM